MQYERENNDLLIMGTIEIIIHFHYLQECAVIWKADLLLNFDFNSILDWIDTLKYTWNYGNMMALWHEW